MGGNAEMRTDGVTQKLAYLINNQFAGQSAKDIKNAVREELQRLLKNGEITEAEAKTARKFLDKDLAQALARRNNVEQTGFDAMLYDFNDLADEKANVLMKEAGLSVADLYDASRLAGADYEISYTHLSKEEREMAENGEITASELKNIRNALNEKIRAKGGERVLDDKETKQLMKALGLSVESKFNIGKILLSMFGFGFVGGLGGALTSSGTKTASATTQFINNGVAVSSTATISVGTVGISTVGGLVGGAIIGGGAEVIRQANRKEEAFGQQGDSEGGEGSVTNKTEAKMHQVGMDATRAFENDDLPSVKPIADPIKELLDENIK